MSNYSIHLKKGLSFFLALCGRVYPYSGIPVLLYHSIDDSGSVISTSSSQFRSHLSYLRRRGYQTITGNQFIDYLEAGRKLPQKSFMITFDDGFRNNYTHALPILKELGYTALIFLVTDNIDGVCSWEKHPSIAEMPLLSWTEIKEMSDSGMEIGSHTCSHPDLRKLSKQAVINELSTNKYEIENKLEKPVDFFAHPYGFYNQTTVEASVDCGFKAGFGGIDFFLNKPSSNRFNLSRIGTGHLSSNVDLQAAIVGTFAWYICIRRAFLNRSPGFKKVH